MPGLTLVLGLARGIGKVASEQHSRGQPVAASVRVIRCLCAGWVTDAQQVYPTSTVRAREHPVVTVQSAGS